MASNTTASQAKVVGSSKQAGISNNLDELKRIRDLTQNALDQYFSLLKTAPDILYVAMAIWGLESGWKLWHNHGGVLDSRHLSPVDPNRSTLIGTGYRFADPIKSFMARPNLTSVEADNVAQGFVAHGLSACMGCYHVRGTPNYNTDFKPYESIVNSLGIAVNPGESITALFPDNDIGKTRSIVAGLIILQNKYKIGLRKFDKNVSKAIEAAVGWYVGTAGARDVNGYSPVDRQKEVLYTPSSKLLALSQIGVLKTGQVGTILTPDMTAVASSTPPSNSVQNDQTRVATTTSTKQSGVGCSTG